MLKQGILNSQEIITIRENRIDGKFIVILGNKWNLKINNTAFFLFPYFSKVTKSLNMRRNRVCRKERAKRMITMKGIKKVTIILNQRHHHQEPKSKDKKS